MHGVSWAASSIDYSRLLPTTSQFPAQRLAIRVLYSVAFPIASETVGWSRWRWTAVDSALLTGLGLAAPAGLNAYLPLLIFALTDRFSSAITLDRPYDFLSSNWGLVILTVLLTIEVVVDKIPGFDHANDLIQAAIRPAAGAILAMAAASEVASLNPAVPMVLGLLVAGAVHFAKTIVRPTITIGTAGFGNPLMSFAEDIIAAITAVIAIFLPILTSLFLIFFAAFIIWAIRRVRRTRRVSAAPSG